MKTTEIHILNGDALRKQLPQTVIGKRITFREALIDGPIKPDIDEAFYQNRAEYISKIHETTQNEYFERSKSELEKIKQTKRDAHINLWFEHDAFCQVNLWFCCHLLIERKFSGKAFLVLPFELENKWQGFGHHSPTQLELALQNRLLIAPFELLELSKCWRHFALGHYRRLIKQAEKSIHFLPYSTQVVAKIAELKIGNLIQLFLQEQLDKNPVMTFEAVFAEFSKEYGILGLGDLQLKYAYDQLLRQSK